MLSPTFLHDPAIAWIAVPSISGFAQFLLLYPMTIVVASASALLLFVGYGLHGDQVGTFASLSRSKG